MSELLDVFFKLYIGKTNAERAQRVPSELAAKKELAEQLMMGLGIDGAHHKQQALINALQRVLKTIFGAMSEEVYESLKNFEEWQIPHKGWFTDEKQNPQDADVRPAVLDVADVKVGPYGVPSPDIQSEQSDDQ